MQLENPGFMHAELKGPKTILEHLIGFFPALSDHIHFVWVFFLHGWSRR